MRLVRSVTTHVFQAVLEGTLIAAMVVVLVAGTAVAAKGGGGSSAGGAGKHGGSTSCTQATPGVVVQNTWAWAAPGSYGLKGQRLGYQVSVINYDTGCGSSSFTVSLTAPVGFAVSIPTDTISLKSGASGLLMAYVTSPSGAANGDYALTASVERSGTTGPAGSNTSYYKVYSTDSTPPTLYWPNPYDGQVISGRTTWIQVSATDDHAVKTIALSIDGSDVTVTDCDDIAYSQSLAYKWTTVKGQHTATFTATDWMGNVTVLSVTFTVS